VLVNVRSMVRHLQRADEAVLRAGRLLYDFVSEGRVDDRRVEVVQLAVAVELAVRKSFVVVDASLRRVATFRNL